MNIVLFSDSFPPEINGVATSTHTLELALRKNKHNVLVVATNPFDSKTLITNDIIRIPGMKLKKMYDYRLVNPINPKVEKAIMDFKPDVFHMQTELGIGMFARFLCKKYDIPMVYTYHTMLEDYTYYVTKGHFDRVARNAVQWWIKIFLDASVEFITPSIKTKDYMRIIGVDRYINVIPTGVDFSRFDPKKLSKTNINKIREEFKISKEDFVFLFLGRIAKEKSVNTIIEGFSIFAKENPNIKAKCVIVGHGPAIPELGLLAEDLGIKDKVIFVGGVNPDSVPLYYQLGSLFASASVSETQGLTYMEAMAANLTVFAKFDNNLLDVIDDKTTGFFFENPQDLAKKVKEFYDMDEIKKQEIRDRAIKHIDNYSVNKFYKRVIGVYERAVKRTW